MPNRLYPIALIAVVAQLALVGGATAAKGYHLWYDENGEAVYSQFPPPNGHTSEMVKPPPPPAESPEVAREKLQRQLQQFEDNREDESLAREAADEQATKDQAATDRCQQARRNLELLDGRPRQLYRTEDGSYARLDEVEREKQRTEMRAIIARDCP